MEYLNRQRIIANWGSGLWEQQYIYFFPFSLFLSVYVYASVCDFVCIALLLPFVLGFCLSGFFFGLFCFFSTVFSACYHWWICFLVWLLSSFVLSFFFSPYFSESCGWQALGAPAGCQACASEVGDLSSGYWSTRDFPAPCNIKQRKPPRDLHLNAKTQLHSMPSKLQCWSPYAKQLPRQEHSPTH